MLIKLDEADLKARLDAGQGRGCGRLAARDQAKRRERSHPGLCSSRARGENRERSRGDGLQGGGGQPGGGRAGSQGAQAALDDATIRCAIDGVVVDKRVDVGDMVTPGQVLLNLYDPTRMQTGGQRARVAHVIV